MADPFDLNFNTLFADLTKMFRDLDRDFAQARAAMPPKPSRPKAPGGAVEAGVVEETIREEEVHPDGVRVTRTTTRRYERG